MAKSIPYSQRSFDKEKSATYINKYQADHYDRITILVPKGQKEIINQAAESEGLKASEWIRKLIDNAL